MSELLEIPFENCTLWTDSKDVIFWIKDQSIEEVQDLSRQPGIRKSTEV